MVRKDKEAETEKDSRPNRYAALVENIFFRHYEKGKESIDFTKDDLIDAATLIGIPQPKNVPDVIYSFRSRGGKTPKVKRTEPDGYQWIIRGKGRGKYCFALAKEISLAPNPDYAETKIPDATPGIINRYALGDEQALLAKIRFNRLIDIFTGLTCYSMQSHLRTSLPEIGQTET
ncbi:MAG: endonuclease, partial [Thermodesulfobacteriota bacterium]